MGQQEIRDLIRPVVLLLDARGQGEEPLDLAVPVALFGRAWNHRQNLMPDRERLRKEPFRDRRYDLEGDVLLPPAKGFHDRSRTGSVAEAVRGDEVGDRG